MTDWIQIGLTIIAGIYALFLFKQNINERKKQFLLELYNSFYSDKDIREILYYVDSSYDNSFIRFQGKLEKEADRTLRYFDLLGKFYKNHLISKDELNIFKYEILRILNNNEICEYIIWLTAIGVNFPNLDYLKEALVNIN